MTLQNQINLRNYAHKKDNITNIRALFVNEQCGLGRETDKKPTIVDTNMNFVLNTINETTKNNEDTGEPNKT